MTMMIKRTLYTLTLSTLMTMLTTISMELGYPQLQLQNPTKIVHVNCSIMIADGTEQAVSYAMKTVHTAIFEHSKIQSTIKDPIPLFTIKQHSTSNLFYLPLPAKLFIDCTEGSVLNIYESDAYKLLTSHPIFKKKHLQITATCTKNPKLAGNSFTEQFNNAMNSRIRK